MWALLKVLHTYGRFYYHGLLTFKTETYSAACTCEIAPNAYLHIQILIILQAAALDRSLGHFKIHSFCQHSLE